MDKTHKDAVIIASSLAPVFIVENFSTANGRETMVVGNHVIMRVEHFWMFWFWAHAEHPIYMNNYANQPDCLNDLVLLNNHLKTDANTENVLDFTKFLYSYFLEVYKEYDNVARHALISNILENIAE